MIGSFKDKKAAAIMDGIAPKGFPPDLVRTTQRKLFMIETAVELRDLALPPGNRLHALKRDREGQHAISINDQFRICFRWIDGKAEDVEIADYH